jgi:hypothetical protein
MTSNDKKDAFENLRESKPPQQTENLQTEEKIDAIIEHKIDALLDTLRANGPLAESDFNKLKLALTEDLATTQAQFSRQDNKSPEGQRTRKKSPALPRRASKSPDLSRAPHKIVNYQPPNGRTSRSPT